MNFVSESVCYMLVHTCTCVYKHAFPYGKEHSRRKVNNTLVTVIDNNQTIKPAGKKKNKSDTGNWTFGPRL